MDLRRPAGNSALGKQRPVPAVTPLMTRNLACSLLLILASFGPGAAAGPPVERVTATYFGTAEDDDLQGVVAAADGTIYVVGNTGASAKGLPGGIAPTQLGRPTQTPRCGQGFVAHLAADGRTLLHYAEFARGVLFLTSVQINGNGGYVSGDASEGLEPLLAGHPGLLKNYPLAAMLAPTSQPAGAGPKKRDPFEGRPGLGRYGAPCIVRLSADLKNLECGTYLEGWQQVWDKNRVAKIGPRMLGGYHEYFWQPTSVGLMTKSGDAIVCHDGGYGRENTAEERKLLGDNEKLLGKLGFYDMCDHVSRLSPDLAKRAWRQSIYTPSIDPASAKEVWPDWPKAHYSNPRTHRLRLDKQDHIYLCGWSASFTSQEPWWSPYLWKLDPADGSAIWKAYNFDPIAGGGHRMGGEVADTACVGLAIDDDGNLLTSLLADGGNSVIGKSPKADGARFDGPVKDHVGVKLVHWWGQISRIDRETRAGLAGTQIGPWGWVTDMAAMPDNRVLAAGRYNDKFKWTDDAWAKDSPQENPNAFLRVYAADFSLQFSTSLPGIVPFELCRLSPTRYALVGRAEHGIALTNNALLDKSPGKTDGYLLVVDVAAGDSATAPATTPAK